MTKKILFLHTEMVIGGVETILVNYLNLCANNINNEVHLVLFQSMNKDSESKVNPAIHIHYLLSQAEDQFGRYTYWKTQDPNIAENDKGYYRSWNEHIHSLRQERLIEYIAKHKIDLVIDFHSCFTYFISDEYLNQITVPVIRFVHSDDVFSGWINNIQKNKRLLTKYKNIVFICEDMQKKGEGIIREYFDLQPNNIVTLYNPLDIKKIIDLSQSTLSDEEQQLLNNNYIVEVARLENGQKNLLQLVEIYAKLKQKGIKEKLYIIGDGPSREEIAQKIKELGLEEDCLLLGAKLNPFPFMKNAKVFVHTANYEGLPTVLIESQICGTPVVAFNCPTGPREILADGKYGELIPMGDEDLFVEKTYELLTNEEKRQHFISLLPQSYQRFSMEKISEQFNTLIQQVLNKE